MAVGFAFGDYGVGVPADDEVIARRTVDQQCIHVRTDVGNGYQQVALVGQRLVFGRRLER